ncbi:hypothetical protein D3C81_1927200 [compost metagenome]
MRARAHHGHLAAQHVQELRQLVQAGAAQEGAHARHAGVAGRGLGHAGVRVRHHRPELEDVERLAVHAEPSLPEQNRTR